MEMAAQQEVALIASDMNVTADDGAVAYSGGGSGSGGSSSDGSVPTSYRNRI